MRSYFYYIYYIFGFIDLMITIIIFFSIQVFSSCRTQTYPLAETEEQEAPGCRAGTGRGPECRLQLFMGKGWERAEHLE